MIDTIDAIGMRDVQNYSFSPQFKWALDRSLLSSIMVMIKEEILANWIVVISEDNLAKALEHQLIGVPISSGRALSKMEKGDRVVFYIGKKRQGQGGPRASISEFGPIAEIVDTAPILNEQPIWHSKLGEKFPWRRKIKILSTKRVKAKELVNSLSFIKKTENWGAYFLNTLREIPDADYDLILKATGVKI